MYGYRSKMRMLFFRNIECGQKTGYQLDCRFVLNHLKSICYWDLFAKIF